MSNFIMQFIVAGLIMGLIDAVWLSFVANRFYKSQIGSLLLDKPNMFAAVIFYVVYVIGVVFFAINPALEAHSVWYAALYGGALGGLAYATYDLTNMATLKGWTFKLVIVDIVWGVALTAAVASSTYWIITSWS